MTNTKMRERLTWVKTVATPGIKVEAPPPFTAEELPEAIASLMAMSDINRFSHVVMDGSPVNAPLGLQALKAEALRLFGGQLKPTHVKPLTPGRALALLPPARLPADLQWATSNPRIADALARWAAVVEREASCVVSTEVQNLVGRNLRRWDGTLMPLNRSWVESEVTNLTGEDRAIARLALVLAKAPYQVDEALVEEVLRQDQREERFIRILAWASFFAARSFAQRIAAASGYSLPELNLAG